MSFWIRRTLGAAIGLVAFAASSAQAATIFYQATQLAGNTWRYDYTVANDSLTTDLEEFTIWFELALAQNLGAAMAPAGWDPLAIQPDPAIPDDGFFDGLALGPGIAPGGSLGGFSVEFEYLRAGTPGSQAYDIVDANDPSILLETGFTIPTPEPGTLLFLGSGLLGLACFRKTPRLRNGPRSLLLLAAVTLLADAGPVSAQVNIPADAIDVLDMQVSSRTRVSRTHFRYDFDVTFRSNQFELTAVQARAHSSQSSVQVLTNTFREVGPFPAATPVTVPAALTVIIDRRTPFDRAQIRWFFRGDGPPKLTVVKSNVDFGSPPLGCTQSDTFEVRNDGFRQGVVDLTGVVDTSSSFDFTQIFSGGTRFFIPSGRTRTLPIRYRALSTDVNNASGDYATDDPALPTFMTNAVGSGTSSGFVRDVLTQKDGSTNPKIDILFTLDRSGSMSDNLTALTDSMDLFLEQLLQTAADFRVAMVVADSGCIVGPDLYVDPGFSLGEAQTALRVMADISFALNPFGSDSERGFTLAAAALGQDQPLGCNEGLIRDDARLALVHVSDEPEQSSLAWPSYVSLFQAQKSDPAEVTVNAVAGDYPLGCGSTATAPSGYYEAVEATGGLLYSICEADWPTSAGEFAEGLRAGLDNTFPLSQAAVPELVSVDVDGTPQNGGFTVMGNTVTFDLSNLPPAGATIGVDYEVESCF